MIFERVKSEGLAHNSYFLGSGNVAVVIDPRRDVRIYQDLARKYELNIKYILETHRNEDYVIGSLELASITGALAYHGTGPDWKYGANLKDGQELRCGKLQITAIYTPGHTNESMSYILVDLDTGNAPFMVFTGDTLFVGDTGRVDFYGKSETPHMAASLYDSIYKRLMPLGDGVILCPGHGGGSICGQKIADRDESTLGTERLLNPILQSPDKDRFIEQKIAEYHEKPPYFLQMEKYNQDGPPPLSGLPEPAPLTPREFKQDVDNGGLIVDTSWPSAYGGAHIKAAYNIWMEGLPSFAGWFLPYDKPLLLVLEDSSHLEATVCYLRRLGYDRITGYLKGGIEGWINAGFEFESISLLSVHQLKARMQSGRDMTVLDVRGQDEWKQGHIPGSINIYVGHLEKRLSEIPRDKPIAVLCSVGHRAGIAASILLRAGYSDVSIVLGSVTAWKHAGYLLTDG
jgi:hydroxyacylglutathione hydrolase